MTQGPGRNDPEGKHEDQQHRAGADGHQGLQHEAGVEVDAIQGTDATGRGVREQLANTNRRLGWNDMFRKMIGENEGYTLWK